MLVPMFCGQGRSFIIHRKLCLLSCEGTETQQGSCGGEGNTPTSPLTQTHLHGAQQKREAGLSPTTL
jgi:hypothetical protein